MASGWLNIYKPQNVTSAACVAKVKKLLYPVKVGHVGTLDPLAEGVLPLAINEATKLAGYLAAESKEYEFVMQFGAKTSTGDAEGIITQVSNKKITLAALRAIIPSFIGQIEQTPSIYSAIKLNGQPAYKLARQGKTPSIPKRIIQIYELQLINFNPELMTATLHCHCSKGTYIRSLAEDIALSLQNLAFVIKLQRVRVGKFTVEKTFSLDMIGPNSSAQQQLMNNLLPIDFVLDDIPVIDVTIETAERIRYGQRVTTASFSCEILIVRSTGRLIAVGSSTESGDFIIKRVFNL